jgi:hypothetical protein
MKTFLLATVVAIGFAGAANAQSAQPMPGPNRTGETQNQLMMNPNTRAQIRTYVQRERRTAARLPSGYSVTVGSTVPADVELYTFGGDMTEVSRYRYFSANDRTVLVDPSTRRVVEIVE